MGLRERKKRETRRRIIEVAVDLFADRGFEQVPVADVAAAADVSTATVFNYFATKEDLIYDGMASFHKELLGSIAHRPSGVSVVAAFRDHATQPRGVLADPTSPMLPNIARIARIVQDSPSLQARERQEADKTIAGLARMLADELGDSGLRPWAAASALVGTIRGAGREVQRAAAAGEITAEFADHLLADARAAIELVETGLR